MNVDIATDDPVFGYSFDVHYPGGFVQLDSVTEGSSSGCCFFVIDTSVAGIISGVINATAGVPFTSGTLAVIQFTATGANSGVVSLDDILLTDDSFNTISFTTGNPALIDVFNPVPEPGTAIPMALLAGGWMLTRLRGRAV